MVYVVIGAMDGILFDNVFNVIKENDYVLFVEPIPYYYEQLKLNAKRLGAEVDFDNVAISDKHEVVQMAFLDIAEINNYAYHYRGCSSVVQDSIPINTYLQELNNELLVKIDVQAITFDQLCAKWGIEKIDYLQIDCEGYDQRIVDNIDLDKYGIKSIKFETHYLKDGFIEYFSEKWPQYRYTFTEGDIIFELL